MGYASSGEVFDMVQVPHIKMAKRLAIA